MIVVVGGTKGGTGKTTIATNLTVMRSSASKKVLLVDADEQKSASKFSNQRAALNIEMKWSTIQLGGKSLHTQISRLKSDYDDIIIDCGGRDTSSQRSALLVADYLIAPFSPSSYDIWEVGEVNLLLRDMKTANPKLKGIAFINRADPSGSDNEDSISILEECEEFECLKFTVGYRKTFRSSSGGGLSVTEVKNYDKKAIQEIQSLYDYIYTENIQKTYKICF
jgi:chromosome partitioning protein